MVVDYPHHKVSGFIYYGQIKILPFIGAFFAIFKKKCPRQNKLLTNCV